MAGKTQKQMIQETYENVTRLSTVILGVPGTENGGLVAEVKSLSGSHYRLKKSFWMLIGILIGSGILGAGAYNILGG